MLNWFGLFLVLHKLWVPSFATSLFESMLIPESINLYNSLDETHESLNYSNQGSPQMTSSPKLNKHKNTIKHKRRPLPTDTEKMRIMIINCQSLRRRKDIFQKAIGKIQPDVIIGTELWLDPSIKNGDIFPDEFKGHVYRKDRKADKHGGVFIAIKNTYISEEVDELKSKADHMGKFYIAFRK